MVQIIFDFFSGLFSPINNALNTLDDFFGLIAFAIFAIILVIFLIIWGIISLTTPSSSSSSTGDNNNNAS